MNEKTITILCEEISVSYEKTSIDKLKYFEENPRVFSCIHGEDAPTDSDKLQNFIEKKLLEQTSVSNLTPDIKKHGGLLEPILVRHDTYQVIEGNSRLAVFRKLYKDTKDEKWGTIPCNYVSCLTEQQQDAYLAQIHIKGKTHWSAYEKANFAYVRNKNDISVDAIAHILSETPNEIKKQITTVGLMETNNDKEKSHFSYYDVLVRSKNINQANHYTPETKDFILSKIQNMGVEDTDDNDFTAAHLRDKFPVILAKKRELKKFIAGKSTLDEAYQTARPSDPLKKVKTAKDKIKDVTKTEINCLGKSEINDLLNHAKKLCQVAERIKKMAEEVKEEKQNNA